jgi:predicted DCC family thiol-disulfide oxidoreductase YuxK
MSKKPRKKRYNPERNYARAARHAVSPLAIVYVIHNEPKIVHAATGRPVALTDVVYRAFHTMRYQWTVTLR